MCTTLRNLRKEKWDLTFSQSAANKCWWECRESKVLANCDGTSDRGNHCRNHCKSQKVKNRSTTWSCANTPRVYILPQRHLLSVCIATLVTITGKWMFVCWWQGNGNVACVHDGILFGCNEKGNHEVYGQMEGTGKYAKWGHPNPGRQTLCFLSFWGILAPITWGNSRSQETRKWGSPEKGLEKHQCCEEQNIEIRLDS